jgi:antitoxin (DNA-binding transcriptional repressor) of toxin-antitoxin stability system
MVVDHGIKYGMDSMPISKFKATCLAALDKVRRTGRPLRVTRFGKPVADIVPSVPEKAEADWLGSMQGTAKITGDISGPSSELADWSLK